MSISAIDCAHDLGEGWPFGTDAAGTSAMLRSLADKLDDGRVLLQSVRVTSLSHVDDYATTGVRLVVTEKKENSDA